MTNKILAIIAPLAVASFFIGTLFKIQHWPGASYMIPLGLLMQASLVFFCLYEIASSKKLNSTEKLTWVIGFLLLFPITILIYVLSARKRMIYKQQ